MFASALPLKRTPCGRMHAPEPVRLERLMSRRGLSEAEARAIMDAQLDAESKRTRAHVVIENDADVHTLERRALDVLAQLRRRAGDVA